MYEVKQEFALLVPDKMMINPDEKIAKLIWKGLEKKGGYCPCLLDRNEDTRCPCKDVRETYECRCGLFIKE